MSDVHISYDGEPCLEDCCAANFNSKCCGGMECYGFIADSEVKQLEHTLTIGKPVIDEHRVIDVECETTTDCVALDETPEDGV